MLTHIRRLVAEQLAMIENVQRRNALAQVLLAEPRLEDREWNYGALGQRYSYWVVAEAPEHKTILVYCDKGFGPEFPWGFLLTNEPHPQTLGMDSQWNWYLEEAFVRSALWNGPIGPDEPFDLPPEERFNLPSGPEA